MMERNPSNALYINVSFKEKKAWLSFMNIWLQFMRKCITKSVFESFPGLSIEPSQKLDDFESPSRCHTSSTNLDISNFVSSIAFDDQNNLDIKVECKHAPGITSTGHKDTNPADKALSALPIQKCDDFESPSVFEKSTVLPTEPWLPVAMPTSLAQSPLNLPGFGPSTGPNNEPILGKVLRLFNSVSITFVINLLFVRLHISTK